jgi:hypothetical protein
MDEPVTPVSPAPPARPAPAARAPAVAPERYPCECGFVARDVAALQAHIYADCPLSALSPPHPGPGGRTGGPTRSATVPARGGMVAPAAREPRASVPAAAVRPKPRSAVPPAAAYELPASPVRPTNLSAERPRRSIEEIRAPIERVRTQYGSPAPAPDRQHASPFRNAGRTITTRTTSGRAATRAPREVRAEPVPELPSPLTISPAGARRLAPSAAGERATRPLQIVVMRDALMRRWLQRQIRTCPSFRGPPLGCPREVPPSAARSASEENERRMLVSTGAASARHARPGPLQHPHGAVCLVKPASNARSTPLSPSIEFCAATSERPSSSPRLAPSVRSRSTSCLQQRDTMSCMEHPTTVSHLAHSVVTSSRTPSRPLTARDAA